MSNARTSAASWRRPPRSKRRHARSASTCRRCTASASSSGSEGRSMRLRQHLVMSQGLIMILTLLVLPIAVWGIGDLVARTDAMSADDIRALEATDQVRQELGDEVTMLLRDALTEHPPGAGRVRA